MVEFGKSKDILREIKSSLKLVKREKDNDVRLMIYNYIGNLYSALSVIEGRNMYPSRKKCFGDLENYQRFMKQTSFLNDKFCDNFIFHQKFHQDYFNDILVEIEDTFIKNICDTEYSDQKDHFGEKDFFEVFHDFLYKYGLEKIYFEMLENKRIFKMKKKNGYDDYLGLTLHNGFTGESRVLIDSLDYDLNSMHTLVHESGHYYDLMEFSGRSNANSFVSYTFKSVFQEVYSRLFEKLFLNYLLDNNIMRDKAIDKLLDVEIINHDYIFSSYIISLLDSKYLKKDKYTNLDAATISKMIGEYFEFPDVVESYIRITNFDLMNDINYAYGDIVSMFLKEEVLAEGLNSVLVKKFNGIRCGEFDKEFFLQEDLNSDRYVELYKKEVQLIKK